MAGLTDRDILQDLKDLIPAIMEEAEAHNQRMNALRDALIGRMAAMSTSELAEFMRDCRNNPAVMELMRPEPLKPRLPRMQFQWP